MFCVDQTVFNSLSRQLLMRNWSRSWTILTKPMTLVPRRSNCRKDPLKLTVSKAGGKPQRLILAHQGEFVYRDRIDTDSDVSRTRFLKKLAQKISVERG